MPSSDTEWCCGFIDPRGRLLGFSHVLRGRRGSWLRVMTHPEAHEVATEMVDDALGMLSRYPSRPVYCTVRDYQGGMQAPLEERGFSLADTHSLLAKHTTVRIGESRRKLLASLEKRVEPAPTISRSGVELEPR